MIIVPVPQQAPPPPPTARSRELGRRIDDLVRDFKRDHPDVTNDELRSALLHSAPAASGPDPRNARRAIGLLVAFLASGLAITVLMESRSTRASGGAWLFIGVAVGVAGLAFAVLQFVRRD